MRKFRSDSINLADPRITYMFLWAFVIVCAVMCALLSGLEVKLRDSELDLCRKSLAECADALNAWSNGEDSVSQLHSSLRFKNAIAMLPRGVDIEPLLRLADSLESADDSIRMIARAYADVFVLLSAIEYSSEDDASRLIGNTLAAVSDRFSDASDGAPIQNASGDITGFAELDTSRYSLNAAENIMKGLFGDSGESIKCESAADGGAWMAEADNLRLVFSSFDGSLESFVYVRLGAPSKMECTENEQIERLEGFAENKLKLGRVREIKCCDRLGGFSLYELSCKRGDYRAVIDGSGRVWSMIKVKR